MITDHPLRLFVLVLSLRLLVLGATRAHEQVVLDVDWDVVLSIVLGIAGIGYVVIDHRRVTKLDEWGQSLGERVATLEAQLVGQDRHTIPERIAALESWREASDHADDIADLRERVAVLAAASDLAAVCERVAGLAAGLDARPDHADDIAGLRERVAVCATAESVAGLDSRISACATATELAAVCLSIAAVSERTGTIEAARESEPDLMEDVASLRERVAVVEARLDHKPITQTRRKDGKFAPPGDMSCEAPKPLRPTDDECDLLAVLRRLPQQHRKAVLAVARELERARSLWGTEPFHSAHEGYGVLLEEVDELKAHVWTNQKRRDLPAMVAEAVQVGAMAVRFAAELGDEKRGRT